MKNSQKIFIFSLASALITSSLVVTSSAASFVSGTSCGGYSVSRNTGYVFRSTQSSGCPTGFDENSIWGGLYSFDCPASSDAASDSGADAAGASSNCTWTEAIQTYLDATEQKTSCSPANTAACYSDTASEETAAVPETTDSISCSGGISAATASGTECSPVSPVDSTAAASEKTAAVPEASDSANSTAADCGTSSCDTPVKQCGTLFDFNMVTSNKLLICLNSIFERCGIHLNRFGICLPGYSDTAAADPTQSSDGTDTTSPPAGDAEAAPSADDSSLEAAPSDDNSTTGTTDNENADNLSFEQQVVALVNEQRAANGLEPLTWNEELSNVARAKSQDMHDNNYFSHTSPTYGSPFDMLRSFGVSYMAAGENIAMGYTTPEAVMSAWMNSSGHRANILNASYTQIGVGYVADGNYWTQEFIG